MATAAAGFVIAWVAVVAYITWIDVRQRRLAEQCRALQDELQARDNDRDFYSRAA